MPGFPPFPEGGDHGSADGYEEGADAVDQARGPGHLLGGQVGKGQGDDGDEKAGQGQALQHLGPDHEPDVHVRGEVGAQMHAEGEEQETEGDEDALIYLVAVFADHRPQEDGQKADGGGGQAGPGGGIAVAGLEEQGQKNHRADIDHHAQADEDDPDGEVSQAEKVQVQEGVGGAFFPDYQKGQADHGGHGQGGDFRGVEPVQFLAPVQHHLQRAHAQGQ